MAEYLPLFAPGKAIPATASATLTAGQLLEVTGSDLVGPAGAASTKCVGVAACDAVSGERVTVHTGGVQHLLTSSDVTAGDVVAAGAAGTVVPIGAGGFTTKVGVAMSTATSGNRVAVQM